MLVFLQIIMAADPTGPAVQESSINNFRHGEGASVDKRSLTNYGKRPEKLKATAPKEYPEDKRRKREKRNKANGVSSESESDDVDSKGEIIDAEDVCKDCKDCKKCKGGKNGKECKDCKDCKDCKRRKRRSRKGRRGGKDGKDDKECKCAKDKDPAASRSPADAATPPPNQPGNKPGTPDSITATPSKVKLPTPPSLPSKLALPVLRPNRVKKSLQTGCMGLHGRKVVILASNNEPLSRCHKCGYSSVNNSITVDKNASYRDKEWRLIERGGYCQMFNIARRRYLGMCYGCWHDNKSVNGVFLHIKDKNNSLTKWKMGKVDDKYTFQTEKGEYLTYCKNCVPNLKRTYIAIVDSKETTVDSLWEINPLN